MSAITKISDITKSETTQLTTKRISEIHSMAKELMKTSHYKKMGEAGIFAILSLSESIKADPFQCLNGDLYYTPRGKVEMEGELMMALIRQAGHSITKDKRSDQNNCILHGKRADTGDTWTENFSIEEAKKAGLLGAGAWSKFPRDMLQWRALSRLARFLFADVIKGCYVRGEVSDAPPLDSAVNKEEQDRLAKEIIAEVEPTSQVETITPEQAEHLDKFIGDNDEYRESLGNFLKRYYEIDSLNQMPAAILDRVLIKVKTLKEEKGALT